MSNSEGWGKGAYGGRKWHYYRHRISLCHKVMVLHDDLEDTNDESPDNCAECRRKRLREKEKQP